MDLKFDEEKWFSTYQSCNWLIPAGEFLKFFSLLYDEKAISSRIIKKDMISRLSFLVTLIYHDQQLNDWLGLRTQFNQERALRIIGFLIVRKTFAKGVDYKRLADYLVSRWEFPWDDNADFVRDRITPLYYDSELERFLSFYWKKAIYINNGNKYPEMK